MGLAAPSERAHPTALPAERAARPLGAALLAGVALTHAFGLAGDVAGSAYASLLFAALICCSLGLAGAVLRGWHERQSLGLGAMLALLAASAYVASRWIGLPDLTDLVGQWSDPAGVASLMCEGLLVALAATQLPRAGAPLRRGLATAGAVAFGLACVLTVAGPTSQPPRAMTMAQAMAEGDTSMAGMDMRPGAGRHAHGHAMAMPMDDLIYPPPLRPGQAAEIRRTLRTMDAPGVLMFEKHCLSRCMAAGPGLWHRHLRVDGPVMTRLMAEYADPGAATRSQRAAARLLLAQVKLVARTTFPTLRAAEALGYVRGSAMEYIGQRHGQRSPFRHFDRPELFYDRHTLDPWQPESLVYWMRPHGAPVLVGMMFRESSLVRPDDPLGPILRWHVHARCQPPGQGDPRRRFDPVGHCLLTHNATVGGTAMVHVWLAHSLPAAYAQDTPARALGIPLGTRVGPPPPGWR